MSFNDIFKKGFLTSYANTEITFRYAVLAMLVCLVISLVICAVYYFKSRKYFFSMASPMRASNSSMKASVRSGAKVSVASCRSLSTSMR